MSIIRRSWVLDSASHTNEVSLDNAPTQEVHDVLTRDGTVRAAFRALAREQISVYTSVSMMTGAVSSIVAENNNAYFTNDICRGQALSQQKVILALGIRTCCRLPPVWLLDGAKEATVHIYISTPHGATAGNTETSPLRT